jgi:predicted kinase
MISLLEILKEINTKPKAIFLAGPAGSGKSTIAKQIIPSNYLILNVDDTYEELLKSSGIGMNQKDFSPDQLSTAATLMAQARKLSSKQYQELTQDLKDIVIDGTGASSNALLKKKKELEDLGYETFMVALFVSPITSLERNKNRERSLLPSIILRTWRGVNSSLETYKSEFGTNFVLINNDPKGAETGFDRDEVKRLFIDTAKAVGKPKTPEQLAKSKAEKDKINTDIEDLVNVEREFNSIEDAKDKLITFTS